MADKTPTSQDVLDFWRGVGREGWFERSDALDAAIRERFAALHEEAAAGALDRWADTPEGALALIILLDQFSRNLYRGSPRAFACDAHAREIADAAIARGFDRQTDPEMRVFFYLPFMHSESLADQARSVALCHSLHAADDTFAYARDHADIIHRFGRFPHRNPALGRHSSPAERAFLEGGGFSG
jgi:uncharacterized protein (DUF924 family)